MTGYSFPQKKKKPPLSAAIDRSGGALLSLAGAQPWGYGKEQTHGCRPMRRQGLFMQSVKVPATILIG